MLAPVTDADRISSIDVVRGAALLGIALMNVVFSGLPMAADFNPKVSGGSTGLNLAAYFVENVLVDGKMRGLFSMMFGASACLLIERLLAHGAGFRAAEIYYRRLLWLMLFGIVHAYLIWHGDILYPYALLGLVLLPLVRVHPRKLLIAAGGLLAVMTVQAVVQGFELRKSHDLAVQAHAPLTAEQKTAISDWEDTLELFNPSAEDRREDRETFGGGYFHLVAKRAAMVKDLHSTPFYLSGIDLFTMMLVGIAFVKTGVLSAGRSTRFYWELLLVSYAIGLPVAIFAAWKSWQGGFRPMLDIFVFTTYPLSRAAITLGHAAALLLVCKYGIWRAMQARLAAVGRMAFSNYIAHSLVYGFVFYGYGFNLFDKLQRYQLYYLVLGMWGLSLVSSPIWLRHFRFGPLEWLWRSLTYWQRQPMRSPPLPRISI